MSIAILIAFVAGALCLGILSALIPFGRREAGEPDEALPYEDEFLDLGEIRGISERVRPGSRQLVERGNQRFGHVPAPVGAVGLHGCHVRAASTYRLTLS